MIRLISLPLSIFIGLLAYMIASPAHPHDHMRGDLDGWYESLRSDNGSCCDGPKKDALHLENADWETQSKTSSHYRVRIPRNGDDFQRAIHGEKVESDWVDVPDSAVIAEPNKAGVTLVWPLYGYIGNSIRCFMPGPLA